MPPHMTYLNRIDVLQHHRVVQVVCILSPEATEDFHHGVGAGIECYGELSIAGRNCRLFARQR